MNKRQIEKELKLDLGNYENYQKLIELSENRQVINQENYFFDTPDKSLSKKNLALRVRLQNSAAFIALKGKSEIDSNNVTRRIEIETVFDFKKANEFITGGIIVDCLPLDIKSRLALDSKMALNQFVGFKNLRTVENFSFKSVSVKLEIDRTEFPDNSIDFELEVEIDDNLYATLAVEHIERLLESLNIPVIYQNESKLARALKKL